MLPAGIGVPVLAGNTSLPWPGAQALSHGVSPMVARPPFGTTDSPKQDQPWLPVFSDSTMGTAWGGTRKMMAWCTSTDDGPLPG